MKVVIPWNWLPNFVEGESSSCDFPCTFIEKKRKDVGLGIRKVVKKSCKTKFQGKLVILAYSAQYSFKFVCCTFKP
jgi:hypothetical protein